MTAHMKRGLGLVAFGVVGAYGLFWFAAHGLHALGLV